MRLFREGGGGGRRGRGGVGREPWGGGLGRVVGSSVLALAYNKPSCTLEVMISVVGDFFEQKSRQIHPLPSPIFASGQTKRKYTIFKLYSRNIMVA